MGGDPQNILGDHIYIYILIFIYSIKLEYIFILIYIIIILYDIDIIRVCFRLIIVMYVIPRSLYTNTIKLAASINIDIYIYIHNNEMTG